MEALDLHAVARSFPDPWRSRIIGRSGNARIKVLRMDATAHEEEVHGYAEALLVLDGRLELLVGGQHKTVRAGELLMVEANCSHAVCAGSHGTLLIVDTD